MPKQTGKKIIHCDPGKASAGESAIDWRKLIDEAAGNRPSPLTVVTYLGKFEGSAANPAKVQCSDDKIYALKGLNAGQMIFNDQVCAKLGRLIGAMVPEVAVADLSQTLIDINHNEMTHLGAGLGHASMLIPGCSGRSGIAHLNDGDNRQRFSRLAMFFGWMGGRDQQYIYENQPPRLVYSVDHGHFFHGGPKWTVETLVRAPSAEADQKLVTQCALKVEEIADACFPLRVVTPKQIAEAVATPPDEWGIDLGQRVALAKYLHRRRCELLATHASEGSREE